MIIAISVLGLTRNIRDNWCYTVALHTVCAKIMNKGVCWWTLGLWQWHLLIFWQCEMPLRSFGIDWCIWPATDLFMACNGPAPSLFLHFHRLKIPMKHTKAALTPTYTVFWNTCVILRHLQCTSDFKTASPISCFCQQCHKKRQWIIQVESYTIYAPT